MTVTQQSYGGEMGLSRRSVSSSSYLAQIDVAKAETAMILTTPGNFHHANRADADLLAFLDEVPESIVRRRDLVDACLMQSKWKRDAFIYSGKVKTNKRKDGSTVQGEERGSFTWVMTIVVVALSRVLDPELLQETVINVILAILECYDEADRQGLRLMLETNNMKTWGSTGQVKNMDTWATRSILKTLREGEGPSAIRQLNDAERQEMTDLLVWILADKNSIDRYVCSRLVFAVAKAMGDLGLKIRCDNGTRAFETEPFVLYDENSSDLETRFKSVFAGSSEFSVHDRIPAVERAHQVAFCPNEPSALIDTMTDKRPLISDMKLFWEKGAGVAKKLVWKTSTHGLFNKGTSEIYYHLNNPVDPVKSKFQTDVRVLVDQAFPLATETGMLAMEALLGGYSMDGDSVKWLIDVIHLNTMERTRGSISAAETRINLFLQYQALVFGFYYQIFESIICKDLIREGSCFWSIWGPQSMMLLAACRAFTVELQGRQGASRSQVLYLLANLYSGRQKRFQGVSSGSLLGIVGRISILTRPLMNVTDKPEDIMKFTLLDLPIVDLVSDTDGELYGGFGGGNLKFDGKLEGRIVQVKVGGPLNPKSWTLHAKMGMLYGKAGRGVVMAARCDGVLVGWFNPLAADLAFLNQGNGLYQTGEGLETVNPVFKFGFQGVEIKDEDWKTGSLPALYPEAAAENNETLGIVHSKGCPELRYAAAGFFMEADIEMSIVRNTDDATMFAAHDRLGSNMKGGFIIC